VPSHVDCLLDSTSNLVRLVVVVQGFAGNTCVELSILPSGVRVKLDELLWDDEFEDAEEEEVEDAELLRELLLLLLLLASAIVVDIRCRSFFSKNVAMLFEIGSSCFQSWLDVSTVDGNPYLVRSFVRIERGEERDANRTILADLKEAGRHRHTPWPVLRKSIVCIADRKASVSGLIGRWCADR